jgi:hypothetical protein
MNIQQAKAEVSSALVEVADQLETILNHKAKIPQIEMDLILSNTQRLYNFLLVLNKLNATGKVDGPGQTETPAVKQEEIAKIIHTEVSKLREELFRTVTNPNKGGNERLEPVTEPVVDPSPFTPTPSHKPQTQTGPSPEKLAAIKQNPFIGKTIMPNGVVEEKVAVAIPVEVKPLEVEEPVLPEHIAEVVAPAPVVEAAPVVVAAPVIEQPVIKFEEPAPQPQPDLTKTFVNTPVQQPVANVPRPGDVTTDNSLANRLRSKPITNIKSAIGINDKFQYLNDLFKGSVQDYNESLDALNNFSNLPDAEAHFNILRVKYGWDMENPSTAGLYELVVRRHVK